MNSISIVQKKLGVFSSVAENTVAIIFLKGFAGIARVFLFLLIAKRFGPHVFGSFSLVFSFVELFKVASDIGVDTVLVRKISLHHGASQSLLNNALTLKIISATGGYIISIFIFPLIYRDIPVTNILLILSTAVYTTSLINLLGSYFQARLKMVDIVPGYLISAVIYVSLTLLALHLDWPLIVICLIIPLTELINLTINFKIYSREAKLRPEFNGEIILALIKESLPVGLSAVMVILYMRMDHLLIGWYQGAVAVGEYSAAFRMTEPFMLIFTAFSLSLYSSLSVLWTKSRLSEIRQRIYGILTSMLLVTSIIAFIISFFSQDLIGLVFKSSEGSVSALKILSMSIIFKALNAQLTAIVNSLGKYRIITGVALNNLIINLVISLILIPPLGVIGAAIAVVVTEVINTVIQSVCVLHILRKEQLA